MTRLAERSVTDALEASPPQTLPFARSLDARAFTLRRDTGDVLIYSTAGVGADVSRRYLGHWHEAGFVPADTSAPLFVHQADSDEVAKSLHVRGTFSRRHVLDDDLEVIPIPGHTPGSTAYLWEHGGHRFLFTADTVFLRGGEWATAVLESSDPIAYTESLELIRELDFDVLVPWIATSGQPWYALTDAPDTRRRIDRLLAPLR